MNRKRMKKLSPPRPERELDSFHEFIQDMLDNAPAQRGASFLLRQAAQYPELVAAILPHIHTAPQAIIAELARRWPMLAFLKFSADAVSYIGHLQTALAERLNSGATHAQSDHRE